MDLFTTRAHIRGRGERKREQTAYILTFTACGAPKTSQHTVYRCAQPSAPGGRVPVPGPLSRDFSVELLFFRRTPQVAPLVSGLAGACAARCVCCVCHIAHTQGKDGRVSAMEYPPLTRRSYGSMWSSTQHRPGACTQHGRFFVIRKARQSVFLNFRNSSEPSSHQSIHHTTAALQ